MKKMASLLLGLFILAGCAKAGQKADVVETEFEDRGKAFSEFLESELCRYDDDPVEQFAHLQNAVWHDRRSPYLWRELARAGRSAGRSNEECDLYYHISLTLNRRDGVLWTEFGEWQMRRERPSSALHAFNAALAEMPWNRKVRIELCWAYKELGRYREALEVLRPLVEADTGDSQVLLIIKKLETLIKLQKSEK